MVRVGFAEHFRHHAFLFFADAVFASDGATGCEALTQESYRKRFGGLAPTAMLRS